ncbi:MAG: YHS domain-containing protein [Patescibacteria group bacterium]|nr:YHS domain-containing protein [Patescibacteria group bacterium]
MQQNTSNDQTKDTTEIVTDPVCGMKKPKSDMRVTSDFQGKIYYFCSQSDKDMFDSHPEHWIPKEERIKPI